MTMSSQLTTIEFIALDLETTGLSPDSERIVEMAAVRFRLDTTETAVFSQLVHPGRRIPWRASGIHGITDDMVADQPRVEQTLPAFLEFLNHENCVLMAHNAAFDIGFLQAEISRSGQGTQRQLLDKTCLIDSLDLARRRLPRLSSFRLIDLARMLGLATKAQHRALADSRVLKDLFLTLTLMSPPLETLEDLLELAPPLISSNQRRRDAGPPPDYDLLAAAAQKKLTVLMVYEGGSKGSAERSVTPQAVIRCDGREYLSAKCHLDGCEKMFRLDRIRKIRVEE